MEEAEERRSLRHKASTRQLILGPQERPKKYEKKKKNTKCLTDRRATRRVNRRTDRCLI